VTSTTIPARRRRFPAALIQRILGAAVAACLAIDAYVHLHDARFYDAVTTHVLSQATLFRVQASLAAAVGLALLIRPSRLWWAAALILAGGAFGAVMLYRYVDVGALGPIPNMYEPTWVSPGKLASAWAEGAATVLTAAGLLLAPSARRHRPITRAEGCPVTLRVDQQLGTICSRDERHRAQRRQADHPALLHLGRLAGRPRLDRPAHGRGNRAAGSR
jgi:hypothetical protein